MHVLLALPRLVLVCPQCTKDHSSCLTRCCAVADLHHDSFYDELPAALRAEVTLEITATVFQGSALLSVLVHPLC